MGYKIVTDGLKACWDAEDWTSGTTWTDNVSSKKLTFSSAPSSKTTDGIELTTSITFTSESLSSLGVSYPCTFEWVGRIDGTWSTSSPGDVFGLGTANGSWSGCIQAYAHSTSSRGLSLDLGSSNSISSAVSTSGIEYHIIVTVNSSGTTTLYVNSTTAKGTSTKTVGKNNKYYLSNSEGSGRFYGAISRMALWNKCLSSTEIATLFEEQASVSYDISMSIQNGTITNPTSNPYTANEGDDVTISFNGNDGYEFSSMTVNGSSVTPAEGESEDATWTVSTNYGTYSTYYLTQAYDGSTSTYWWSNEAQAAGKYVQVEFSAPVTLNSFSVYSSNSGDYVHSINELQVSSDGSTWTTVGNFTDTATSTFNDIGEENILYARIYATGTISNWMVINEITVGYTTPKQKIYSYTLSDIEEDKTISIVFVKSAVTTTMYLKVDGSWIEAAAVYKKVNGSWVQQTDLTSVFTTGTNYKKG